MLATVYRSALQYSTAEIEYICAYPHLLGHLAGKNKLTPLHSYWIRYLWDSATHAALEAHRGSYKTTSMAIGAVRWMLLNPDDRIGLIRKRYTDAAEVVKMIEGIMAMPAIKALFQSIHKMQIKAVIKREGKLVYNFKATQTPEGNVNAHGLDASLTGKHYDKILADDFVTLRDRLSMAEREKTKEILREIVTNIIDPGHYVMFTGTPWHRLDGWTAVPATPLMYPVSATGLLSPAEIAEKKRTTTPFLYAANYDLDLTENTDAMFKEPRWGKWDYLLPGCQMQLDAAFDGDHFCALTALTPKGDEYQGRGWLYGGNVKDWIPEIVRLYKTHRVKVLHIETNPDKGYTADALKRHGLNVRTYWEDWNKHHKITSFGYEIWPKILWDEDTDMEYLSMSMDYSQGQEPDDSIDSLSSLAREGFKVGVKDTGVLNKW